MRRGTAPSVTPGIHYLRQTAVIAASPMQSGEGTVTPIALADCSNGAAAGSGAALVCGASLGSGTRGPIGVGKGAAPCAGCWLGALPTGAVRVRRTTAGAGS
ncbi:hypothetical protein RHE_CH01541 [Rhizobium etli CFN 42]|uniref:Uncharacterized protein n=1 Tax=Rhizobium etli (strain ATCC 51251 / DSM 11541 / JCM 21823 / NBRC 15573 / CFN 42) TaxID=347834 RepID=Q2K9Z2_RHIEC|nr:hypothetical protein RHE_CH01541 [Rhizobium etli CFN 42]